MIHSTNTTLETVHRTSASLKRRSIVGLCAVCVCALYTPACNDESKDIDSIGGTQSPASAASVNLGDPYLSGTCTPGATAWIRSTNERYVTVVFSNQQYAGDRNSPEYVKERIEGRLIGDAKSTAPKCELHVPMRITAGYRFSPTNVIVHGFAHRAFVFGAYRWANTSPPNNEYTFERQVPINAGPDSIGDNFVITEPLHNLWSPTCQKTGGGEVNAELIVTIQPYTSTGTDNTIVAIDSFDVAGYGSLEKCDVPTNWDPTAQEGESCGEVNQDHVHPVRCDTSKQTNVCVYHLTNQKTGTCVNVSKAPASRVVERDDDCGGPFYSYCVKDQPLVCQFVSGSARQNASANYGKCVDRLPVGSACKTELFGACDGYSCNTTADPCQAGSKCTNGKCVASQGKSQFADASGDESGAYQDNTYSAASQNEPQSQYPDATENWDPSLNAGEQGVPEEAPRSNDLEPNETTAADAMDTSAPSSDPSADDADELWSSFWG